MRRATRRIPIKRPKPSEALAEFFGIFIGDGSFSNRYQISIAYNYKCEEGYARYVDGLIYGLFGIRARRRIRKRFGSAELIFTGSNLVEYIRMLTGIKEKLGKESCVFPKWLSASIKCKRGFIRGLFDSEGCVYRHSYLSHGKRYSYVKIAVTNYDDRILTVFQRYLRSLGIESVKYDKRIHIYDRDGVRKYFQAVGSNNNKNLKRYRKYSIAGEVPKRLKGRAC